MFSGQGQNNCTQEKDSRIINFMSDIGYVGQNARERNGGAGTDWSGRLKC